MSFVFVYNRFDLTSPWRESSSIAVDAFKRETHELIEQFLDHRLTYPQCLFALDATFASLRPSPTAEELSSLRSLISANYELVMQEMERRISIDHTTRPFST